MQQSNPSSNPVRITCRTESLPLTDHARQRMNARSLPEESVVLALSFGRRSFVRGERIHAIGRKEVVRLRKQGIDLSAHQGVRVVCSAEGDVITVYRNHDLKALRPRRRRRRDVRIH